MTPLPASICSRAVDWLPSSIEWRLVLCSERWRSLLTGIGTCLVSGERCITFQFPCQKYLNKHPFDVEPMGIYHALACFYSAIISIKCYASISLHLIQASKERFSERFFCTIVELIRNIQDKFRAVEYFHNHASYGSGIHISRIHSRLVSVT